MSDLEFIFPFQDESDLTCIFECDSVLPFSIFSEMNCELWCNDEQATNDPMDFVNAEVNMYYSSNACDY